MQGMHSALPGKWNVAACGSSRLVRTPVRSLSCQRLHCKAEAAPDALAATSQQVSEAVPDAVSQQTQEAQRMQTDCPIPQEWLQPRPAPAQHSSQDGAAVQRRPALRARGAKGWWRAYGEALDKWPIRMKSATSFVGFMLGDLLAQAITGARTGIPYNAWRTLRLVLFGMFMDGPIGHWWYTTLDKAVLPERPKSNRAVVTKMLADQMLWAPAFSCVFFVFINVLSGKPGNVLPDIKSRLMPIWMANLVLWVPAHLINFKFIPGRMRIAYINCISIIWSAYLSNASCGKASA